MQLVFGVIIGLLMGIGLTLMFTINWMLEDAKQSTESWNKMKALFDQYIKTSNEKEEFIREHHRLTLELIGETLNIDELETEQGVIVLRGEATTQSCHEE